MPGDNSLAQLEALARSRLEFKTVLSVLFGAAMMLVCNIGAANALKLSDELEIQLFSNIPDSWTAVTFENTYSSPVAICTYNLATYLNPPAVARVKNVGASGMSLRSQVFDDSGNSTAIAGDIHCLIAEAGLHTLPNGTVFQAGSVVSTLTQGHALGWAASKMENLTGTFNASLGSPILLAGIMTANDPQPSVAHISGCGTRTTAPFGSNYSSNVCVGKHVGFDTDGRANETVGYLAITKNATGIYENVEFLATNTPDSIEGVEASSPSTISLSTTYDMAVLSQESEDGGNGGWAVLYGSNPLGGGAMNLAIDESWSGNPNQSRAHTKEEVEYFLARELPYLVVTITPDPLEILESMPVTYNVTIENGSSFTQNNIYCNVTNSDGTVTSLPVITSIAGSATTTVTHSFTPSQTQVNAGVDLITNISCLSDEYAIEARADATASATVTIGQAAPDIEVEKVADDTTDAALGQVIEYTYTVTNTGNVSLFGVNLTDSHNASGAVPVPGSEVIVTDNVPLGDTQDSVQNGTWEKLGPGDVVKFTGTYTVTEQDIVNLQ